MMVVKEHLQRHGVGYLLAIVATAGMVLLRWLLDPVMGDHLPFVTVFGAVVAAVWYGGYRPAILATVLGYLACDYLFIEPRGTIIIGEPNGYIGLGLYLFTCSVIIWLGEGTRMARQRADQQHELLRVTFASMGDGVITTDAQGRVASLNKVAAALTGWAEEEAVGRRLEEVFHIVNEQTRQPVVNPVERVLAEGKVVGLANHTTLIAKDGTEQPIDDSAAPIRDAQGVVAGVVLIFRNVTERRRAEASTRLVASIVESSDDAIIGKNIRGIITSWNGGAERIFGYTAAEAVGRPVAILAPPGHADEMPAILARISQGERIEHFDTVRRAKDGRLVPISLSVSPIRNEYGQIVGASKIARDISERKRAEEALREEKERLHTTLISIGDAVIVTDAQSHITMINPVAQSLSGWKEEAIGRPLDRVFRILNEQTRAGVESPVARVLREGTIVGLANHTVLLAKDGTEIPIDDSAAPIKDGQGRVTGCVLVFRDITSRRKGEQSLRKKNLRLSLLSESAALLLSAGGPDAMLRELFARIGPHFELDTYLNYMVNEAGDALRLESYMGIPLTEAQKISRLEFGQAVCGTVAHQRQPIVATHIQQSDDPKVQLVRRYGIRAFACNPLMVGEKLLGTLSFGSHSRDHFEPEELEFLQAICHYIAVAYERVRFIQQLREADRRKDEFLATLAHELRNPLASIRIATDLLQLKGPTDPELQKSRDMIDRQVRQMTRLVDDLMEASRIARGKLQVRKERMELGAAVRSAIDAVRPFIEAPGHELTVTVPAEPIILHADSTRLAQVIANLLSNAAKYTEQRGHIWLTVERREGEAVISVRDTGIGIAAEHLPHVFEKFSQIESALDRSQGGLGIGLSLVRGLIELHSGRVEARSDGPGKGSEFIIYLPIAVPPEAKEQPEPAKDHLPPRNRKSRILVVDDNRDIGDGLTALLRTMGHETDTAYDGLEAVQIAATVRPQVILLDIGLPKLNGYEAARRIREQPWGKAMALIALTGWGQEEDKRRALDAGFDHHLTKPVDAASLEKMLAIVRPPGEP